MKSNLTIENKIWITIGAIAMLLWLYLPFEFLDIAERLQQEAIEHPFLGSTSCPEGGFFVLFAIILSVGDFGIILFCIGCAIECYESYSWDRYQETIKRNRQESSRRPEANAEA